MYVCNIHSWTIMNIHKCVAGLQELFFGVLMSTVPCPNNKTSHDLSCKIHTINHRLHPPTLSHHLTLNPPSLTQPHPTPPIQPNPAPPPPSPHILKYFYNHL